MNVLTISGRIGRGAEVRYTGGGTAVASFSVANDTGYGEKKTTNWFNCSMFGKRAEGGLIQYLVKGQEVCITGELTVREYQDKDGNKRTSVDVFVKELDLIGSKGNSGGRQEPSHDDHQTYPETIPF